MAFAEDKRVSAPYRAEYLEGIRRVIGEERRKADAARAAYMSPEALASDPERFRRDFLNLMGAPLARGREGVPKARVGEAQTLSSGVMRRVHIEVMPGLPLTGLLIFPSAPKPKYPLIIAQHGGGGTPELMCGLHGDSNYGDIVPRLLARGYAVFAPQLLLWNEADEDSPKHPGYSLKKGRDDIDAALRHLGGGIAALEVFALTRALDYLVTRDDIDDERIGMIGLSYGGFYTQVTAAADTRIRAACSSAFFNDRYAYCWTDFAWAGAARCMLDAEICALIAPRALCVHVGRGDTVFSAESAERELSRLPAFFKVQGALDKLNIIVSCAEHTFTNTGAEIDFFDEHLC